MNPSNIPSTPNINNSQERLLEYLKQGLISYIRTVGSTLRSHVSQQVGSPGVSQTQIAQLDVDLQWLLDQSNALFNHPNLVLADLALANSLLSHLRSVVESFMLSNVPLPKDYKLLKLIVYYIRLAKAILFLHQNLYQQNKQLVGLFDDLIVEAGKVILPFFKKDSEEYKAMESLVEFHNNHLGIDGYRKDKEWIKRSENYGTACAKVYLRWLVGYNIDNKDIFEFATGRNTFDIIYEDPVSGILYVIEAKAGVSRLGARTEGQKKLKQGTLDYLKVTAQKMQISDDAQDSDLRQEYGDKILEALADEKLIYLGVKGRYNTQRKPYQSPDNFKLEAKKIFLRYLKDSQNS